MTIRAKREALAKMPCPLRCSECSGQHHRLPATAITVTTGLYECKHCPALLPEEPIDNETE